MNSVTLPQSRFAALLPNPPVVAASPEKPVVSAQAPDQLTIRFGQTEKIPQVKVNQGLEKASAAFTSKLMGALAKSATEDNLIFSPSSVWNLLVMVLAGAKEETRDELADVMGLGGLIQEGATTGQLLKANKALMGELGNLDKTITLLNGYGAWARDNEKFVDGFVEAMKGMDANIDHFAPGDATKINDWVNENTRGMIPELFKDQDLAMATAVLANALYLKAPWKKAFDKDDTYPLPFHGLKTESRPQTMRKKDERLQYLETDDAQIVRLPYGTGDRKEGPGNELSMTIILPKQDNTLTEIYRKLSQEDEFQAVLKAVGQQHARKIDNLSLPRFKNNSETELKKVLQGLGLQKVFLSGAANLKAMLEGNSFISRILQKAVVDVNEEGTEAAAVTAAVIARSAIVPRPQLNFLVDRPFLYTINDQEGRTLFVGTVNDLPDSKDTKN